MSQSLAVAARSPGRSRVDSGRSGWASSAIFQAAPSCSDSRAIRWSTSSRRRRPATRFMSARALPARAASERGRRSPSSSSALHHRREDRLRLGPAADGQVEALAAAFDPARQAMLRAMLKLAELREQFRRGPAPRFRPRRSASARAGRRHGRSASCRSRARRPRSAGSGIRRPRGRPLPR